LVSSIHLHGHFITTTMMYILEMETVQEN